MRESLLDTSILISFLKGEQKVVTNVEKYLGEFDRLSLSILTYYEILRGLKYLGNERKIRRFEALMDNSAILTLDRAIIRKASEIYAAMMRRGELIEDADILIAASCLINGMVLVTADEEHFRRIEDLEARSWGIEVYHRGIKQCCGIEQAQVRRAAEQKSHLLMALRAFLRLEAHRLRTGVSWYGAKTCIVREAIRAYLAHPRYTLGSSA